MEHFLEHIGAHFGEILLHTLIDTLKLLPFLFLTYLLMEFLEHRSASATEGWLHRAGKFGPLVGSALGIVPQCGFSAAASGLYSGRVITAGTLIAVYLSTSDEMLPILLSSPQVSPLAILKLLLTKLAVGMAAGFLVDWIASLCKKKNAPANSPCIEEFCEREHCKCQDHFALSALKHTLKITVFILIINLILNLVIHGVGEDQLKRFVSDYPILSNLFSALVGLIPNCASSVAITELYISGVLSIGAALSGLLVNAGIGVVILFRNNRPVSDSFRILGILFAIGLSVGILVDLTGVL